MCNLLKYIILILVKFAVGVIVVKISYMFKFIFRNIFL